VRFSARSKANSRGEYGESVSSTGLAAAQSPPDAPPNPDAQRCAALTEFNLEVAPGGPAVITSAHIVEVHTFRHTYSTLLRAVGADLKVMQELLRHSTIRVTLDTYTQAVTAAKRAAHTAVVSLIVGNGE